MSDATLPDASRPAGAQDPAAAAAYVAAITGELARLARDSGLGTLAYILEMARLEAKATCDGVASGRPGGRAKG